MVRDRSLLVLLLLTCFLVFPVQPVPAQAAESSVVLEEVVTDPQQDWDGSGSVTSSDEYVVLRNTGGTSVNLTGWRLVMQDSTPEEALLSGVLAAGAPLLLLNPIGLLNNDVRLQLYDPADTLVDEATLDGVGTPDGDAAGLADEAVHLDGPWAGEKGPATGGTGLPALWLESLAAAAGTVPAPFAPTWVPTTPGNLSVRLHVAPATVVSPTIWLDDQSAPLALQEDGVWSAGPFTPSGVEVEVRIVDGDMQVDRWANGTRLRFPVDPGPPALDDAALAVTNSTGHLRWVPSFRDVHSGIAATGLSYTTNETEAPLPACAWPETGEPTCALPDNVTFLLAGAVDHTGQNVTERLEVTTDDAPPRLPSSFHFDVGVPPRFGWNATEEPLAGLVMETADDAGGTWNRTRTDLEPDARTFTDAAWSPGAPRAYRLVATDRGGNTNTTPWVALPPEAVPVQATLGDANATLDELVLGGSPTLHVAFDRPVAVVPRLVLESHAPSPFRATAEGSLDFDLRGANYTLAPDAVVPATGRGAWRLVGGEGADGAPTADVVAGAVWDHEAPRVEAAGWQEGWIAGKRHVVVLSAHDRGDPSPRLEVSGDTSVRVRNGQAFAEVVAGREGIHTFQATAEDASGNAATTGFVLRLDGTPPLVRLAVAPERWTSTTPIEITTKDTMSGVDTDSVTVEVRNEKGQPTPTVAWNGTRLILKTTGDHEGPFEIHLRLRDLAGNEAGGILGERVAPARLGMGVTVNGTTQSQGDDTTDPALQGEGSGHIAPTSGEPASSWSDLTGLPPTDTVPRSEDDGPSEGNGMTAVLTGLVGAGLLGLGTVVHKRRRARASVTTSDGDPRGTPGPAARDVP